jgi:predicted phage replisome organizer
MSDNKKYYYLKLKDNFFEQDAIKIIEGHTNGYIYSNILLKLYLKAIKYEGCLRITEAVPYAPSQIELLSRVINHDPAHVSHAIKLAINLELMTVINSEEMWFTDIQNYIGHSSTEGDRIKNHRLKLKDPKKYRKLKEIAENVQMYDKRTPELEIDIESDKEKDINKDAVLSLEPSNTLTDKQTLEEPEYLTPEQRRAKYPDKVFFGFENIRMNDIQFEVFTKDMADKWGEANKYPYLYASLEKMNNHYSGNKKVKRLTQAWRSWGRDCIKYAMGTDQFNYFKKKFRENK